jgi:hypothetical protein
MTSFNQLHGYQPIRSTYHTTLQATERQLVFGRGMIHNIAFRAYGPVQGVDSFRRILAVYNRIWSQTLYS